MASSLPIGWSCRSIGEIAEVKTGGTPSRDEPRYWEGNVPWMSSGEIHQRRVTSTAECITDAGLSSSNAAMLPRGAVMMALNGQGRTRGTVAVLETELSCNQSLAAIIPNPDFADSDFLFHYLDSQYQNLRGLTGDGGRNGLNLALIRALRVPLPTVSEQRRIAQAIGCMEAVVERTRAVIDQTRKLKAAMLHDLLINGLPGRHKHFKSAKRLGRLPETWSTFRLGDLTVEGICYGVVQPGEEHHAGVPLVRVCDIEHGDLAPTQLKRIDPVIASGYKRSELRGGELLVTLVGTIGRCTIAPPMAAGFNIARAVAKVQIKPSVNNRFVMHFLNTIANAALVGEAFESARKTLNLAELSQFPIALPDRNEQDEIVQAADAVEFREKAENDRLIGLLNAKAALSQALLTGRVRVPAKGTQ